MTLIHVPGSSEFKTGVRKWKNEFWEKQGMTPNEAYSLDKTYRKMIRDFATWNDLRGPFRFFEVRIVSKVTSALYTGQKKWWDHKRFMDHVFWMFQTPIVEDVDGEPYYYWVLEPFECQRVWQILIKDLGQAVPDAMTFRSGLAIPKECCVLAWTETANGTSEHIHERAPEIKTQQQLDYEKRVESGSKVILERVMNLDDAGVSAIDPDKLAEGAKNVR